MYLFTDKKSYKKTQKYHRKFWKRIKGGQKKIAWIAKAVLNIMKSFRTALMRSD